MPHATVSEKLRGHAKQLRRAMTPAETLLWRYLKANRIDGLGFRRQFPIRNYIADFACLSVKVIVELDGWSHDHEAQQKADQSRDAFFEQEGFQILRFTNQQVMSNLEGVVESIRQTAAARTSGSPPSPRSSEARTYLPHRGGGSRSARTRNSSNPRGPQP